MSTLSTAVNNAQWELAAHLLVLAALQTLNGQGTVPGASKGGKATDGTRRQRTARR